ncbi:MAG: BolA family transcriptional regulator [Myxococcales bacterium]|nr:BolA family transcriptional regulator [Myxococcales bacterium]
MIVEQRIHDKLVTAFAPVALIVENQSDRHSGPPGRESHFKVVVVSPAFAGQSLVARHRAVNTTLADELRGGVHALAIEALTPEQWTERGGAVAPTPPCLGGSKR